MKTTCTTFLLLSLVFWNLNSYGQKSPPILKIGETQKGELAADGIDPFTLIAAKDQFVYGYVDQISVDVVVNIYDPKGEKLASFDNPARGPENFTFETEEAGTYKIEVESFKDKSGAYEISLVKQEALATDPAKRVDQLLSAYDNEDTPGVVVGVVKDGKMIFSKAYGMANLVHGIPFSTDLPSNIGSVSKQFTAMAILLLEKEGKLSLEDDVRKHIPELPDFGQKITLKNLLNHTNGLREIYNTMPMRGWDGEDKLLREEAIRLIQRQTELQADPGEEFNYNNTAFIMLAGIVERISGEKFPDWMKANVFEPLGMSKTMVRAHPKQIVPQSTQGYRSGESGYQEAGDLAAAYGAGAIYTTLEDLNKWLRNFKEPVLGGEKIMDKLLTPGMLNNGDTMTYALGIGVMEYRGQKKYQHTGGDIAHRALLAYFPELDAGVITMSNNAGYDLGVANKIADAFFGDKMDPKKEKKVEGQEEGVAVDPEILKTYTGKYKMETVAFIIEYKFEEDKLVAYPQGQSSNVLKALSDTSFSYTGVDAQVVFHQAKGKEVHSATHHQGGNEMKMQKLAPYNPDSVSLKAFAGKYYSEELETFYSILIEDGKLIARHINMEDISLSPVEEDEFSGSVFFFTEIKFQHDDTGKVTGFTASNGRTKGMVFLRHSAE